MLLLVEEMEIKDSWMTLKTYNWNNRLNVIISCDVTTHYTFCDLISIRISAADRLSWGRTKLFLGAKFDTVV